MNGITEIQDHMQVIITRDGEPQTEAMRYDSVLAWFHRHVSYSMSHALEHEGWDVVIDPTAALDVWLRIPEGEEESEAEANTFIDGDGYVVKWYLTAVGLVTGKWFPDYDSATAWLEAEGFEDFTA